MAWGTPTSLGSTTATSVSATSFALTGITASIGTLVVAVIDLAGAGTFTGAIVTDSAGNTWTTYSQVAPVTGRYAVVAYSILTNTLSSGSITVTRTGSGNISAVCFGAFSVTGGLSSSPEDTAVKATAQGTSISPSVTGNTATQAGNFLVSVCGISENAADTYTEDATHSWTNLYNLSAGATVGSQLGVGYQTNAGTSGVIHNPSLSVSRNWAEIQIAFSPALTGRTGTLAATEGADTLSATGALKIQATLSKTEAADTLAATAQLKAQATLAKTENADTLAANGQLKIQATLAKTESADVLSATAQLKIKGLLAASEQADSLAATGKLKIQSSAAITEAPDTLSAHGSGTVTISGSLAATEQPDSLVSVGKLKIQANAGLTEQADTLHATGGSGVIELQIDSRYIRYLPSRIRSASPIMPRRSFALPLRRRIARC